MVHAKILLGCYRSGEANDPAVYVSGIAAVLARYPTDLMARVSDPRVGLPSKLKWLPSISEVTVACEELAQEEREARKRASDLAEQWRLRDEMEARANAPKLTDVDPCNLFIRRDYRGFQEMRDAKEQGKIKHLRWDADGRDGIHVNHAEYGRIVGFLRQETRL